MAIDTATIRASIIAAMEASGSFSYGAFAGQTPQALAAKVAQTSTATHWFDVRLTPSRNHPSSNVGSGNSRRLLAFDVTIPVWTRLPTAVQRTARDVVRAAVESACEEAAKDLSRPGTLSGVVGGLMLARDGRGAASYRLVQEDWSAMQIKVEIHGTITVTSVTEEPDDPPSLEALGSDLLYHWEVPAADSEHIDLSGSDVTRIGDRGQSAAGPADLEETGGALTYDATGGPNGTP